MPRILAPTAAKAQRLTIRKLCISLSLAPTCLALHRLNSVIYFSLTLINKPASTSALLNTQTLLSARKQAPLFCLPISLVHLQNKHTHTRPHPLPPISFKKIAQDNTEANTGEPQFHCRRGAVCHYDPQEAQTQIFILVGISAAPLSFMFTSSDGTHPALCKAPGGPAH